MLDARKQAIAICETNNWPGGLANLAIGYGMRRGSGEGKLGEDVPTVVGLSRVSEVHESVKIWREIMEESKEDGAGKRKELEESVVKCFVESGWSGWSWASPSLS